MFTNVRYVDPKLWYENGIPDMSDNIGINGIIGAYSFNKDAFSKVGTMDFVSGGLKCYDYYFGDKGVSYDLDNLITVPFPEFFVISSRLNVSNGTVSLASGYEDNFAQKMDGYLKIDTSGTYYFRLRSDDRGLLYIDGNFVSSCVWDNTVDSSINLSTGYHSFCFYTIEYTGSQLWQCQWKKPGDGSFSDIPSSVLYHSENKFNEAGMLNRNIVDKYNSSYETVKGVCLNKTKFITNDGYSVESAKFFSDETADGTTVTGNTTNDHKFHYYRVKLKAGVTYTLVYTEKNFDTNNGLFKEDGTVVVARFDADSTWERMTYTPSETGNFVFMVCPHSTDYGYYRYSVTPAPEEYKQTSNIACDSSFLYKDFTNQDLIDFVGETNGDLTVSLWFMPEDLNNIVGNLVSVNDSENNNATASLFFYNNKIYFYNGTNSTLLYTFTETREEFKLLNKPFYCNLVFVRRGLNGFDLFLNNTKVYTSNSSVNITGNRLMVGDALNFTGNPGVVTGYIKILRIYKGALSNTDIKKLYDEITNIPGDGTTYEHPYGQIPKTIEDDTLYLLRRYDDGTATRIEFNSEQTATKVGIFGFPSEDESDSEFMDMMPSEVRTCPWLRDTGTANFYQANPSHRLISSTIKHFECRNINILTNPSSGYYLFELSADRYNFTIFDRCRFSCKDSNIDSLSGTNFSSYDRWYYRHNSGSIQNLIINNCTILYCNNFYDAFRCNYCENATITNNKIYSSSTGGIDYNGFCFAFIRNCEQTYSSEPYSGRERYYYLTRDYDNSFNNRNYYTGNTNVSYLTFKNNEMIYRHNSSNYGINGLLCALDCRNADIDNIKIHDVNNLGTPTSSPRCANGLIYIRGVSNYKITNIDINLTYSSIINYYPLFSLTTWYPEKSMAYNDYANSYTNYPANYNRILKNINIYLGDQHGIGSNGDGEILYKPTDTGYTGALVVEEPFGYCAFAFRSLNNKSYYIDHAENINVIAPTTGGIFLQRVFLKSDYLDCPVRSLGSRAEIGSIRMRKNLPALYLWYDNNIKVGDIKYDDKNIKNNVITYGVGYNSNAVDSARFVYINSCNKRIIENKFYNVGTDYDTYNSSIIYCPNTKGVGGLTYQSYLHGLFPCEYNRYGGNSVSLALRRYASKKQPMAIPVFPNKGIKRPITSGSKKLKIHFALFGKTIEELIKQENYNQFFIQFEVENKVYDSRLHGSFVNTYGIDLWSYDKLIPFVYELNFNCKIDCISYMRIYFDISCSEKDLLLFDPVYEIEDRS